jgi:hypothetical protein
LAITFRTFFISILLLCVSCKPVNPPFPVCDNGYYNVNQTQFTFLVFDKSSVDTFFLTNDSLIYKNEKLRKEIVDSLTSQVFAKLQLEEYGNMQPYTSNTDKLDSSYFDLAANVIEEATKGDNEYFSAAVQYLFFYKCLPAKFKYKWFQTSLGHFSFNANFFALLRDKSKELDDLIYGNTGYWDKELQQVLKLNIYNEITAETAGKIRQTIVTDSSFNDKKFELDRINFLEFLDKTIANEWRLILVDWD